MKLGTVPKRAVFEVKALSAEALILLFGKKKARTPIPWDCLEGIPQFLSRKGWVEIRSVHITTGIPGSLDGYLKTNGGPIRTTGGYVAAVLEAAGIVDVNLRSPAMVRLKGV
jgi:hypothetical protein